MELSVAIGLLVLACLLQRTLPRPAPPRAQGQEWYRDDPEWYAADYRPDPLNPDEQPGTRGYRLELLGGPLAGRRARLRDSRFRLWVMACPDGAPQILGAIEAPGRIPAGGKLLGGYEFSHGEEAMTWRET